MNQFYDVFAYFSYLLCDCLRLPLWKLPHNNTELWLLQLGSSIPQSGACSAFRGAECNLEVDFVSPSWWCSFIASSTGEVEAKCSRMLFLTRSALNTLARYADGCSGKLNRHLFAVTTPSLQGVSHLPGRLVSALFLCPCHSIRRLWWSISSSRKGLEQATFCVRGY